MIPGGDQRFLFIHLMKTGGTSFADILRENFDDTERYPDVVLGEIPDNVQRLGAYLCVTELVREVNCRQGTLRAVSGHIPYAVRSLLSRDYIAMTILRDPVERTISYLKHARKYHEEHRDWDLERIYEAPWFYESFIHNYQTKIFSLTPDESLAEARFPDRTPALPTREECLHRKDILPLLRELAADSPGRLTLELYSASTGVVEVDRERLAVAMSNLREVDLIGITERYHEFLEALRKRYGWKITTVPKRNVSKSMDISPAFRMRIEQDNALDMELYELASSLAV